MWPQIAAVGVAGIILVSAATTMFRAGQKDRQTDWDVVLLAQSKAATAASEAYRTKEQALQTKVAKVSNDYAIAKTTSQRAAATADGQLRQLQAALDALGAATPGADSATSIRTDDLARTRAVVGQCAKTLAELAANADAGEARLSGLQEYVRSVIGETK